MTTQPSDEDIVRNYFKISWETRAARIKLVTKLIFKLNDELTAALEEDTNRLEAAKYEFDLLRLRLMEDQISVYKFQFQIVEDLAEAIEPQLERTNPYDILWAIVKLRKLEELLKFGINGDDELTAYKEIDMAPYSDYEYEDLL